MLQFGLYGEQLCDGFDVEFLFKMIDFIQLLVDVIQPVGVEINVACRPAHLLGNVLHLYISGVEAVAKFFGFRENVGYARYGFGGRL